jgi:hypothetical protein
MNKKVIALIIAILGIFLGYVFFAPKNTGEFLAAYEAYDAVSAVHEASAHVPGGGNNVSRQKLNAVLSRVLTENFTPEERLGLSKEGLVSSGEVRKQIDAIKEQGEKTDAAAETLRRAAKDVGGFFAKRRAEDVYFLAQERMRIIQDIEEISYGTNARIENILRGIIADNGTLTPERISALNNDLPEAERQFDLLMENYRKLDDVGKRIDAVSIPVFIL